MCLTNRGENIINTEIKICKYCTRKCLNKKIFEIHNKNCIYRKYHKDKIIKPKLDNDAIYKVILSLNMLCCSSKYAISIIPRKKLLKFIHYFTSSLQENEKDITIKNNLLTLLQINISELYSINERIKIISKYLNIDIEQIKYIHYLTKSII